MNIRKASAVFLLFVNIILISCHSASVIAEIEEEAALMQCLRPAQENNGGAISLTHEIRSLTKTGILPKMVQALEIIHDNNLSGTEFGRIMNAINAAFISRIYPGSGVSLPFVDLPLTHIYARIMREAAIGNYSAPSANSGSFFEHILPFLAVFDETSPARLLPALPDLEIARQLRPDSVLPHYFRGLVLERSRLLVEANAAYNQALEIDSGFFPALAGIARLAGLWGRTQEAAELFANLAAAHPDDIWIKRQFAAALYENNELSRAQLLITEILQKNPSDGEFLLMYAHILIEQGQFSQAQMVLGTYTSINPISRQSLFLRARLQAEGFRNRDSALNYLHSILRSNPDDEEAAIYAVNLLMESRRPENKAESRELLELLQNSGSLNNGNVLIYIAALIDNGRREEAWGMIERRLADVSVRSARSQLFFLRSRIQRTDEESITDLRFSLFEDPRNLQALIAMVEIHHRRGETHRAVHYLRQALNIAPDDPRLERFEQEYALHFHLNPQ